MNKSNRIIIKTLFYFTLIYSVIALLPYAQRIGGPCNAGVAFIGIGLFLIICAALLYKAIRNITKPGLTKRKKWTAIILSIVALIIWSFWTFGSLMDSTEEFKSGLIYFLPFLITSIVTTTFAIRISPELLTINK